MTLSAPDISANQKAHKASGLLTAHLLYLWGPSPEVLSSQSSLAGGQTTTAHPSTEQYAWHRQPVYLVWPPPTLLDIITQLYTLFSWLSEQFKLVLKSRILSDNFFKLLCVIPAGGMVLRDCCAVVYKILTLIVSMTSCFRLWWMFYAWKQKCWSGKLNEICLHYACLS